MFVSRANDAAEIQLFIDCGTLIHLKGAIDIFSHGHYPHDGCTQGRGEQNGRTR